MAITDVSDQDFDKNVLENSLPVLVDFWAEWCGPCKLAEPVLNELSDTYNGSVAIMKIDVDQNPTVTQKYGVLSIPTTILFQGGQEIGRQVGFSGKQAFEELVQKAL